MRRSTSRTPRRLLAGAAAATALSLLAAGCSLPGLPGRSTNPGTSSSPASTGPRVLLDDSFSDGSLNTSVWNTCHWWNDNGCTIASNDELEWYRPEGVDVADGMLQLTAERGDQTGADGKVYPFRSGMVTTGPEQHDGDAKLAFTYGTVEARLRVPAGKGLWSAMWLLPADEESRPEIDLLEILGNDPTQLLLHFHPRDRNAESPSKTVDNGTDYSTGWHDFKLVWAKDKLDYYVDNKVVWTVTGKQVPDEPMYLIFNLAVGGVYPGDPDDSTRFPATFAIDRVKITSAAE